MRRRAEMHGVKMRRPLIIKVVLGMQQFGLKIERIRHASRAVQSEVEGCPFEVGLAKS